MSHLAEEFLLSSKFCNHSSSVTIATTKILHIGYQICIKWGMICRILAISSVYGSCDDSRRGDFWNKIWGISHWVDRPWLIGGDFNVIHFCGERMGLELYLDCVLKFNGVIRELSLLNLLSREVMRMQAIGFCDRIWKLRDKLRIWERR